MMSLLTLFLFSILFAFINSSIVYLPWKLETDQGYAIFRAESAKIDQHMIISINKSGMSLKCSNSNQLLFDSTRSKNIVSEGNFNQICPPDSDLTCISGVKPIYSDNFLFKSTNEDREILSKLKFSCLESGLYPDSNIDGIFGFGYSSIIASETIQDGLSKNLKTSTDTLFLIRRDQEGYIFLGIEPQTIFKGRDIASLNFSIDEMGLKPHFDTLTLDNSNYTLDGIGMYLDIENEYHLFPKALAGEINMIIYKFLLRKGIDVEFNERGDVCLRDTVQEFSEFPVFRLKSSSFAIELSHRQYFNKKVNVKQHCTMFREGPNGRLVFGSGFFNQRSISIDFNSRKIHQWDVTQYEIFELERKNAQLSDNQLQLLTYIIITVLLIFFGLILFVIVTCLYELSKSLFGKKETYKEEDLIPYNESDPIIKSLAKDKGKSSIGTHIVNPDTSLDSSSLGMLKTSKDVKMNSVHPTLSFLPPLYKVGNHSRSHQVVKEIKLNQEQHPDVSVEEESISGRRKSKDE